MSDGLVLPIIDVDEDPDRPGWAVVTLAGAFASPVAVRVLGGTLIEVFGAGIDTLTVNVATGPATRLSPAACHVVVDAARYVHQVGGCLVVSGVPSQHRSVLRALDVDNHLVIAR